MCKCKGGESIGDEAIGNGRGERNSRKTKEQDTRKCDHPNSSCRTRETSLRCSPFSALLCLQVRVYFCALTPMATATKMTTATMLAKERAPKSDQKEKR